MFADAIRSTVLNKCNGPGYALKWKRTRFVSDTNYVLFCFFYVVRTVHFGMKLYNDQRNAQVFNLFIYLLLPYMFRAFF
jgi:hypothetical protein